MSEKEPISIRVKAETKKIRHEWGAGYGYGFAGSPGKNKDPYINIHISTTGGEQTLAVAHMLDGLGVVQNPGKKDDEKHRYEMNYNYSWLDVDVFSQKKAGEVIRALVEKYPELKKDNEEITLAYKQLSNEISSNKIKSASLAI